MALRVDRDKCIGCGSCVALCPECFELDEEGKSQVIGEECESCNLNDVAASCPVGAIEVEEEEF